MKQNYLTARDLPEFLAEINRRGIGFERMFEELNRTASTQNNYPPHNIVELSENKYCIELAAAGFREDELEVSLENHTLTVAGTQAARGEEEDRKYWHHGVGCRSFSKSFSLADNVVVQDAKFQNGLLVINLEVVVPEELRPRKIPIATNKQLEAV